MCVTLFDDGSLLSAVAMAGPSMRLVRLEPQGPPAAIRARTARRKKISRENLQLVLRSVWLEKESQQWRH